MKEIIERKFSEWKGTFGPKEARISVFTHIRDIPYYLVPQVADPFEWAASVLETGMASCSPKHYLLGTLFVRLGVQAKYVTYAFKWDKQALRYPPDLEKLAQGVPSGYHVACKAYIENKWVLVDATWDSALSGRQDFPVNTDWDGISDTRNAVIPFDAVVHDTLEQRLNFVKEKRGLYSEEEKRAYAQFIERFNLWLDDIRGSVL